MLQNEMNKNRDC